MNKNILTYCIKISITLILLIPVLLTAQSSEENYVNSLGIKMIKIQPGEFEMGNPNPTIDSWDEQPVHKVKITKPFYISETEVTLEQYRNFKKDFEGTGYEEPSATGLNWYDAVAFCEWLSEKEGKTYRLTTEAEWEYACRAGTSTDFWSGNEVPEDGSPNPWGLKNMHSGAREWCYDWYGLYSFENKTDPVGPEAGFVKVVRGGGLDIVSDHYKRSANRAGMAPSYSILESQKKYIELDDKNKIYQGLFGTYFGDPSFNRFNDLGTLTRVDYSGDTELSGNNDWSAIWQGFITAPATGEITFYAKTDRSLSLIIDNKHVIDLDKNQLESIGKIELEEGEIYPVTIDYTHDGGKDILLLEWKWEDKEFSTLIPESIFYTEELQREISENYVDTKIPGQHRIGFRVVQAEMPSTKPLPEKKPFVRQCVVQNYNNVTIGPDPNKPWFKKRWLLPTPPENEGNRETIREAGLEPGMMGHNHSPALEVCPNGDLLLIIYTSEHEYEPEVSLMAARLRFGSEQWDMPEILFDFPEANDHAPMLWTDNKRINFFWGNPRLQSAYPFQWTYSDDNGVTWSEVQFPKFVNKIGPHSRQPINTSFRSHDGTIYLASDAIDGTSVLWASSDNGRTWYDTEGRSAGRHTTYAELKNGDILGMGGKNTDIDGYMPKAISDDGGKTWEVSKTPFASQGSNQRPSLLRLQSGRLFFAGDFQDRDGQQPEGINRRGSYVALSEDEGNTWHIKKLAGALPHEHDQRDPTIGYSAASQAPNGVIHLITTMNSPSLHFEMNEAWILADSEKIITEIPEVNDVKSFELFYPRGELERKWEAGTASEGRYLLHGNDTWYYKNGLVKWEVKYEAGNKVGRENFYSEEGSLLWSWNHREDGISVWTQYYPNGNKKSISSWRDGKCEGTAQRWDINGSLISEKEFESGKSDGSTQSDG